MKELKHMHALFKTLLDSTGDVVAVFDTDLNYILVNKAAEKLLGRTAEQLVGHNMLELFPALTASSSHRCLLRAISGETIPNAVSEGTFTQPGAKYITSYTPVIEEGKVTAVVAVTKKLNLSDPHIAELLKSDAMKNLQVRIDELEDFLENASMPLHQVNGSGIIIWANKCELDLLGYSREEYVGRHIANFHADKQIIDEILRKLINKENLINYPAKLKTKDGAIKEVLINSNVFWRNGQFVHTRCFTKEVEDISRH